MIVYCIPLVGIFELTDMLKASLSSNNTFPVSILVVNTIFSSETVTGGGGSGTEVFLQAIKDNKKKIKKIRDIIVINVAKLRHIPGFVTLMVKIHVKE